MNDESGLLIVTASFNGLLNRVAKVDYWDVWLNLKGLMKEAKKQRTGATIRMSAALSLTGLTKADAELFVSLHLLSIIHADEDPLLSVKDVFSLVWIFERIGREEVA